MRTIHVSVCLALALASFVQAQSGITSRPAAHFGFELAADGKFAMWDQEVAYYEKLAKESDRIDLQVLGKSTLGRPFHSADDFVAAESGESSTATRKSPGRWPTRAA